MLGEARHALVQVRRRLDRKLDAVRPPLPPEQRLVMQASGAAQTCDGWPALLLGAAAPASAAPAACGRAGRGAGRRVCAEPASTPSRVGCCQCCVGLHERRVLPSSSAPTNLLSPWPVLCRMGCISLTRCPRTTRCWPGKASVQTQRVSCRGLGESTGSCLACSGPSLLTMARLAAAGQSGFWAAWHTGALPAVGPPHAPVVPTRAAQPQTPPCWTVGPVHAPVVPTRVPPHPPADAPLLDIVFIHGIRGGAFATWRREGVLERGQVSCCPWNLTQ